MGDSVAIPGSIFANYDNIWLGLKVSSDPEMSPRSKISSAGFAFKSLHSDSAKLAENAELLNNNPPSYYLDWNNQTNIPAGFADGVDNEGTSSGGDITAVNVSGGLSGGGTSGDVTVTLPSNSVTSDHIQTDAVNYLEIADGAVRGGEIATGAVGSDEIATAAVGASEIATNAVNYSEIATGAVRSDEIYDGTIQQVDLSFTAVDESSTQTIPGTKTFSNLNISTTTRKISIASAAFVPQYSSTSYARFIGQLRNGTTGAKDYYASVSLPDGAIVTQLEGTFVDTEVSYKGEINLTRVFHDGAYGDMAYVSTSGTPGFTTIIDNSIDYATINNELYNYVIWITIQYSSNFNSMRFYGAEIQYTITKPLP